MLSFSVDPKKCIKCEQCVKDCPMGIIHLKNNLPQIIQDKEDNCLKCQHCLAICPTGALSIFNIDPEKCTLLKNNFPKYDNLEILVKGRRSIRKYKDENIPQIQIDKLLTSALHAPTGVNAMQVHFTVIDNKEVMSRYRKEIYDGIIKSERNGKLPEGMEFFSGIAKKWQENKADIIFRNAPHMLIASAPRKITTPKEDAIIALSYFDLLASADGIGTLWCGMAKWAIEDIVPKMRSKLGIAEDHVIGYIILFGKPDVKYYRTAQKEQFNIVKIY